MRKIIFKANLNKIASFTRPHPLLKKSGAKTIKNRAFARFYFFPGVNTLFFPHIVTSKRAHYKRKNHLFRRKSNAKT